VSFDELAKLLRGFPCDLLNALVPSRKICHEYSSYMPYLRIWMNEIPSMSLPHPPLQDLSLMGDTWSYYVAFAISHFPFFPRNRICRLEVGDNVIREAGSSIRELTAHVITSTGRIESIEKIDSMEIKYSLIISEVNCYSNDSLAVSIPIGSACCA
jgi:hypothetical protein